MVQAILERARKGKYDFRTTAFSNDPMRHLFEEWVPYYRTKWAIARTLRPTSILEIGVRYGYSALAFLNARPTAQYFGIDIDNSEFGGETGAIHWAREATKTYRSDFLIADSQKMTSFPGGMYDLIHVDGQQDGDGSIHDLELALRQGRYILVDGYLWTKTNFQAVSEFLHCFRDQIEYYSVIPGYAGELLIRPKEEAFSPARAASKSSDIKDTYTGEYFLFDCGGYDSFKQTGGLKLTDPRLRAVADLACTANQGRALDLGCGRGELSIFLARQGFEVTGVDYSADAIGIANKAVAEADDPTMRIQFVQSDLNEAPLSGLYDVITAADVIEHLSPDELDRLYEKLSAHLAPGGVLVLHTYPNEWCYRFDYPRRRKIAASVGAYLPTNPRSRFERLMHINEQSPAVLRKQLRKHFPVADVWFAGHDCQDPFDNLRRKFTRQQMRAAEDLFAVASHSAVAKERIQRIVQMNEVAEPQSGEISIRAISPPESVAAGKLFSLNVRAGRTGSGDWTSRNPAPVHLSYHWLRTNGEFELFDGRRALLFPALREGTERNYEMEILAPETPGEYILRVAFVQEGVRWMDDPATGTTVDVPVLTC